jgi:hypothetical protein
MARQMAALLREAKALLGQTSVLWRRPWCTLALTERHDAGDFLDRLFERKGVQKIGAR